MTRSNTNSKELPKASSRGFCTIVRANTKGRLPALPYEDIKNDILGKPYSLTIAYVDEKRSEELHIQWKHKDGPANILSFPYSKLEGEIVLHLPTVYSKSAEYSQPPKVHLLYLIIHGCLHLKGYIHSNKMDKEEILLLAKYREKLKI